MLSWKHAIDMNVILEERWCYGMPPGNFSHFNSLSDRILDHFHHIVTATSSFEKYKFDCSIRMANCIFRVCQFEPL